MPKTQTELARSPFELAAGQPVEAENLEDLSRLNNWLFGFRAECHLSLVCGGDGWDSSGNALATLDLTFPAARETRAHTDFYFNRDAANHTATLGVEAVIQTGSDVGTVYVTLTGSTGAVTRQIDLDNSDNGSELTASFDLSTITPGDEWVEVEVELEVTTGSGTTHECLEINFEEDEQTSSLPDPSDD